MRALRFCGLPPLAVCIALGAPARSTAAPGDVVATIPLPSSCFRSPAGLGFDGELLYYTERAEQVPGTIHLVEAATGADRGSFLVLRDGVPVDEQLGGLVHDAARRRLWAGWTDRIYGIDLETAEIVMDVTTNDSFGVLGLTRDPIADVLWECSRTERRNDGWCPTPRAGERCGGFGLGESNGGLTFDGVDLWHFTSEELSAPAPAGRGFIYPTDLGSMALHV